MQGAKVHDTRLVAAMNVHGVGRILTFNANDFTRYGVESTAGVVSNQDTGTAIGISSAICP